MRAVRVLREIMGGSADGLWCSVDRTIGILLRRCTGESILIPHINYPAIAVGIAERRMHEIES